MRLWVLALPVLATVSAGCATVPGADAERAYISIAQSVAGPDGCDFSVKNIKEGENRRSTIGMTRDFPPAPGSLRSSATYAYATQHRLQRPAVGETRCLVVIRERQSFAGEPQSEFAFEMRSLDDQSVEIRPRQAIVRSAARWRTQASRVNVSVAFGLVDIAARGRDARVLDQTRADMGWVDLGSVVPTLSAPVTLKWPQTTPMMRGIAVVGERLNGRADPGRRIMTRQAANTSFRHDIWPPAR